MTLVLEAMDLCAQEKAVLLAICNHTDATGKTFAGEQRLMRESGMPRTTFQRWRSKLVERDLLISREKRNTRQQRQTSDTWVNLPVLRSMRDPFFARAGRSADEEDMNPFDVVAGQDQAPSVGPGEDVQAPPVGHPGPVSGARLGPTDGAPNPQMIPTSSIARAAEVSIGSVAAEESATDDDEDKGQMSPDQIHEIVAAVIAIRPEWQPPGIQAQLRQVMHLPYAEVRRAFEDAAANRSIYTPMHLASAAQDRMVTQEHRERAQEHRERQAEDWRREVHADVANRARPESRAEHVARLKAEAQAARVRAQGKSA